MAAQGAKSAIGGILQVLAPNIGLFSGVFKNLALDGSLYVAAYLFLYAIHSANYRKPVNPADCAVGMVTAYLSW